MKIAVRVLSYTLGILTLIGSLTLIADNEMTGPSFIAFLLVEAQVILTLIYTYQKKN